MVVLLSSTSEIIITLSSSLPSSGCPGSPPSFRPLLRSGTDLGEEEPDGSTLLNSSDQSLRSCYPWILVAAAPRAGFQMKHCEFGEEELPRLTCLMGMDWCLHRARHAVSLCLRPSCLWSLSLLPLLSGYTRLQGLACRLLLSEAFPGPLPPNAGDLSLPHSQALPAPRTHLTFCWVSAKGSQRQDLSA